MNYKINGDFSKGRELMKHIRSEKAKERNKLERAIKKKQKENQFTGKLEGELSRLNLEINRFSVSKMIPLKLENGVVVNGKIFERFIKKLRGFFYTLQAQENTLQVRYGKIYGEWTGELHLHDVSHYYEGFNDIPELEIFDFLD